MRLLQDKDLFREVFQNTLFYDTHKTVVYAPLQGIEVVVAYNSLDFYANWLMVLWW